MNETSKIQECQLSLRKESGGLTLLLMKMKPYIVGSNTIEEAFVHKSKPLVIS